MTQLDKYPEYGGVYLENGKKAPIVHVNNLSEVVEAIAETNDLLTENNALLVDANGHLVDVNGNLVEIKGELVSINTVEGTVEDPAVVGDEDGTISAKLRGISTQLLTPTKIGDGSKNVATAGTPEALGSTQAIKSITITAKTTNTGIISVGGETVEAGVTGVSLEAGDSLSLDIADLASVYIDATVNGNGVAFTWTGA